MILRSSVSVVAAFYLLQPIYAEPVVEALPAALTVDLPTTLLGSDCRISSVPASGAGKVVICLSKNFRTNGMAGVTVVAEKQATYEDLVKQMRGSFHESGPLKVVSESKFAPATAPEAVGLRAEYEAGSGRKFTWSVSHQGALTRVMVTVFGKADMKDVEPEVLAKVFGPDRYPAGALSISAKPVEMQ
jgi:hypothetical protein